MIAWDKLVPMRWPSETQFNPLTVEGLHGSAVNCLVTNWPAGPGVSLAPFIERCRQMNISVVGWVDEKTDAQAAIASAKAAGLTAVAIKEFAGNSEFPVIPWAERSKIPWRCSSPVIMVTGNVWPGVKRSQGGGAQANPTGLPWLDSNGWFLRLARDRAPGKQFWLLFDPPGKDSVVRYESYEVAVMDATAHGGRWVVSLDHRYVENLLADEPKASKASDKLFAVMAFAEKHASWNQLQPMGVVGILSDFTGPNEDMAGELLNLTGRRQLPYRTMELSKALGMPLAGFKAILAMDEQPPKGELRRKLLNFVSQGGLLLAGKNWGFEGKPRPEAFHPRFDVQSLGKGRLAIAKEESFDPFEVAEDAHMFLSRANDLIRFFNAGSISSNYLAAPGGKSALLHVINYSGRAGGNPATVWLRQVYRTAQLWSADRDQPEQLKVTPEAYGVEVYLPPLPVYGGIELSV